MTKNFVHLHLHTQYSVLDGAIRPKKLIKEVLNHAMPAIAITDHNNLFGAVEFTQLCKNAKIKPIIGMELNITNASPNSASRSRGYHITLLCKNLIGYHNLLNLISYANLNHYNSQLGFATAPFELLQQYAQGLIGLSGDLGSEISTAILNNRSDIDEILNIYKNTFDNGAFYLEVMDNSFPEQKKLNQALFDLSQKHTIPTVATNDCHYLYPDEATAHAILICMQLEKIVNLDDINKNHCSDFYLKSPEQMWNAFKDHPEACENTLKIADEIDFEIPLGKVYLPQFDIPTEFTQKHNINEPKEALYLYFKETSRQGLKKRLQHYEKRNIAFDRQAYEQRLELEINVITQMDFPGYFLIVWDFINWSKQNNIPVGPGRGSGAGSLVAYALEITDLDPMPYGLLFERFLNPERVSMPDFDIDFCQNRRSEVIEYVTRKYGQDKVAQIATFGALKARAAIKDIARTLNISFAEANQLSNLIPKTIDITLEEAYKQEPKLRQRIEEDPKVAQLYELSLKLEGLYKQIGMHAAGVVISQKDLWEHVPICRGANNEIITQYPKGDVEEAGLVKFDFLGLKNLTSIQEAVRLINRNKSPKDQDYFDIHSISLDDPEVYKLLTSANTTGVFQLESSGMRELVSRLKPDCFEDIIAILALYRPGPLGSGMVDTFIECKHGLQQVQYPHPSLEPVLKETYGVIVYQEQVMQCAQILSGYTLGAADIMRRAMGKKKPEEMAKQRQIFVDGAVKNNVPAEQAAEIFDNIEKFTSYGFNKSHSAAYALIAYQTAYLKAHYPVEFSAALMTCDKDNTDAIVKFILDTRENNIAVLPPDINESFEDFSVSNNAIRFGLGAIKGIGSAAIQSVIDARNNEGPFKSFYDFCNRVDLKRINKRVLEALIKSGAFDSTWKPQITNIFDAGKARSQLFDTIPIAIERAQKVQQEKQTGQTSLFTAFSQKSNDNTNTQQETYQDNKQPWNEKQLLTYEKDVTGFYISGHPLQNLQNEIKLYTNINTASDFSKCDGKEIIICGMISSLKVINAKNNAKMAFAQLEDIYGQLEIQCFAKTFIDFEHLLRTDQPIIVQAKVSLEVDRFQNDDDNDTLKPKLRVLKITSLEDYRLQHLGFACFSIDTNDPLAINKLTQLKQILELHKGNCQPYIQINDRENNIYALLPITTLKITINTDLIQKTQQLLGPQSLKLQLQK